MEVGKAFCKVVESKVLHRALGMEERKEVCKAVAHKVEDMQVCMAVGGMVLGMVLHKALDMRAHKAVDIEVCKALGKQACMVVEGIQVCMADIPVDMVRNSHLHNDWSSLSTRVSRHPKEATRLLFLVVFSLKDSLC